MPLRVPALFLTAPLLRFPALPGLPFAFALPAFPALPFAFALPDDLAPHLTAWSRKQERHNVAQTDVALRPHCLKFLQSGGGRLTFVFITFFGMALTTI